METVLRRWLLQLLSLYIDINRVSHCNKLTRADPTFYYHESGL